MRTLEQWDAAAQKATPGPDSWKQYNHRGIRRAGEGDLAGALADFDTAIRLAPPTAVLHQTRGSIRMRAGDLDGARQDFEQGLALGPGNKAIAAFMGSLERLASSSQASAQGAPSVSSD
jgi:Flp pilus assembly protein TadD